MKVIFGFILHLGLCLGVFGKNPIPWSGFNLLTSENAKFELESQNRLMHVDDALKRNQIMNEAVANSSRHFGRILKNTTLKVLVKPVLPYILLEHDYNIYNDGRVLGGLIGELWNTLESELHFRTKIIRYTKNHTKDYDVALNPREWTVKKLDRPGKFSYTRPIGLVWYQLFTKANPNKGSSSFYLQVLHKNVWLITVSIILVFSIALWAMWRIRKAVLDYGSEEIIDDTSYPTCLLSILGSMINQECHYKSVKLASIQLLTLTCVLFGLILTTSFSALLISKLATSRGWTIERMDLKKLSQNSKGRVLCVSKSNFAYARIKEGDPHYIKGTDLQINKAPCTAGNHDIVPAVDYCSDQTVVLETIYNANYAFKLHPLASDSCKIYAFPHRYFTAHLRLAARKDFPFMRNLNEQLLRILETGMMKRMSEQWQPKEPKEILRGKDDFTVQVSFEHIQELLFMFLAAVHVSVAVLAVEIIYKWSTRKFSRRHQKQKFI